MTSRVIQLPGHLPKRFLPTFSPDSTGIKDDQSRQSKQFQLAKHSQALNQLERIYHLERRNFI
jgi:hypothetical protein